MVIVHSNKLDFCVQNKCLTLTIPTNVILTAEFLYITVHRKPLPLYGNSVEFKSFDLVTNFYSTEGGESEGYM